jgi:hypothetical protein
VALPSTPEVTDWPSAVAASPWVTTEHESNLPPAATAEADGDGADVDVAAAGLLVGAPDDEAEAAGEDGEPHAASKTGAPHAMTEIATRQHRIVSPFN